MWGLLSVSVQLKRSRRRPEECVSSRGCYFWTNCRHITDGSCGIGTGRHVWGEISVTLHIISTSQAREEKKGLSCFLSEHIFLSHTPRFLNYTAVIHNDKVDLAPFSTDRRGFCSVSSHCEISPGTFHFPAAVKWLKDTDQPV